MQTLFVNFYTDGNGYEAEASGLVGTLAEFGLPHDVRPIAPFENWQAATQFKPLFIRERMRENPGRSIVWIDADARIVRSPDTLQSLNGDFAAVWRGGKELLAGFLWFGPTPAAAKLLDEWILENQRVPNGRYGDQLNLQHVVERTAGQLTMTRLPPAYCAIFDANMCEPHEVVILQTQASRRLKT